ncbi:MAG: biotin synthase BioB [Verrucomicrobiae bacterium]|jgi:biotin synthase|nr:biotin synthase BioB [Verrucomicrobiae bacterium]
MSSSLADLQTIYETPFFDLIRRSNEVHRRHWKNNDVQLCTLLSIKTGGCSEDCSYCAQSARYKSELEIEPLMKCEDVLPRARQAKENGAARFCMGTAWRGVKSGDAKFNEVLKTVREVSKLGMEVCVTLGLLGDEEACQLKEAGVTAYNHNIDTSPEYYPNIISTRTFQDRLDTIAAVQRAGMSVCCGGIIGMGESITDRLRMLEVLCNLDPAPESVPLNCLVPMPGTPLADQPPVDIFEFVRLVATARIVLPHARVRLSAGRDQLSREGQALCFFAGANSIHYGEKLLTAENPDTNEDVTLLQELGLLEE